MIFCPVQWFFLHGAPFDATLTQLPDPLELREQKLPDQALWDVAVGRAGHIFGVAVSPLLKAGNVTHLVAEVKKKVADSRVTCQSYCQKLTDRMGRLGMTAAETDRMKTAVATFVLVERLHDIESDEMVDMLATADVVTSESAMGESWSKTAELCQLLETTNWEIFEAIAQLIDDRQAAADEVTNSIREALTRDEYVKPLALALKAAQSKAVRLLATPTAPPEPDPAPEPVAPPESGHTILASGSEQVLDLAAAKALLLRLDQELRAGQKMRLNISWIIETDGAEQ